MRLGDGGRDGQADARSIRLIRAVLVETLEGLE